MPLQEETKVCAFEKSEQDKIEKYCLSSKNQTTLELLFVCIQD